MNPKQAALLLVQSTDPPTPRSIGKLVERWYLKSPDSIDLQAMNTIRLSPRVVLDQLIDMVEELGMFVPDDEDLCLSDLNLGPYESMLENPKLYRKDVHSWVMDNKEWLEKKYADNRLEWIWRFGWLYFMYEPEPFIGLYAGVRGRKPDSLGKSISFHSVLTHERKRRINYVGYTVLKRWGSDFVQQRSGV